MSTKGLMAMLVIAGLSLLQIGCHVPMMKRDVNPQAKQLSETYFDQSELSPKEAARTCIVTAEEYERAGHHSQAISLYEKARQHDAGAIDYSRRLSVLYDQAGQGSKALVEYQQALAADPSNAELLNDFGYFQFRQGDLAAAEATLRKAVVESPENQRARTNLGIVLAHQGRYDEAFATFSGVVGPAAAHSNIGAVMAKQGHTQSARQAFQQALAIDPELQQPRAFLDYFASTEAVASLHPTQSR